MTKTIPGFDAVALQHEGGRRIYELTKDMTKEERIAYWETCTEALLARQRELRRQAAERAEHTEEPVEQAQ
jgi:hypothetical protein